MTLGMTMGTPPLWFPDAQAQTLQVTEPYADPVVGDHAEAINANPAGVSMGERFNSQLHPFQRQARRNRARPCVRHIPQVI